MQPSAASSPRHRPLHTKLGSIRTFLTHLRSAEPPNLRTRNGQQRILPRQRWVIRRLSGLSTTGAREVGSLGGGGRSRYGQMCFGMMPGRGAVPLRGRGGQRTWWCPLRAFWGRRAGNKARWPGWTSWSNGSTLRRAASARAGANARRVPVGAQPQTGWPARFRLARAVGRLTSMLSPNGLFEGAPKVAESPTVKFDRLAVRLYNWTLK